MNIFAYILLLTSKRRHDDDFWTQGVSVHHLTVRIQPAAPVEVNNNWHSFIIILLIYYVCTFMSHTSYLICNCHILIFLYYYYSRHVFIVFFFYAEFDLNCVFVIVLLFTCQWLILQSHAIIFIKVPSTRNPFVKAFSSTCSSWHLL